MARPSSILYRFSRFLRDAEVVSSGDPRRIATRAKNKAIGRTLAKSSWWRRLWR